MRHNNNKIRAQVSGNEMRNMNRKIGVGAQNLILKLCYHMQVSCHKVLDCGNTRPDLSHRLLKTHQN